MSVSDGQAVSSSIVNNSFVSKSAASTMAEKLTLNRASSGSQVTDVQQSINNQRWSTYTTEDIAAAGTVSSSTSVLWQYRRVQGDGGAKSISDTPFGTGGGWADGLIIRLVGISSTNTISFNYSDVAAGGLLNGDITLGKGDLIDLQYDSVLNRWIEISRNN